LSELDKARDETFKVVQEAIGKLEGRLNSLDQELVRPSGLQERPATPSYDTVIERPEYQDVETVEATIADLKGQIEQLKSELENVA
jgi:phage shock protein A